MLCPLIKPLKPLLAFLLKCHERILLLLQKRFKFFGFDHKFCNCWDRRIGLVCKHIVVGFIPLHL